MKARILILVIAGSFAFSGSLWAHHGSRQVYQNKSITLSGVVTGYEWANPHSILSVAVKDDRGKVDQWHAEILPPRRWCALDGTKTVSAQEKRSL